MLCESKDEQELSFPYVEDGERCEVCLVAATCVDKSHEHEQVSILEQLTKGKENQVSYLGSLERGRIGRRPKVLVVKSAPTAHAHGDSPMPIERVAELSNSLDQAT
jgi:hypothetical protein